MRADRWSRATSAARPGDDRPAGGYRGPDRRGLLSSAGPAASGRLAAGLLAGSTALLAVAAAAMAHTRLAGPAWTTALADVAFGIFLSGAVVLAVCWRLTGEAAAAWLAGIAAVASATVVPLLSRPDAVAGTAGCGVEVSALLLIGRLALLAVRGPDVQSDLRPVRSLASTAVAIAAAGLVAGVGPGHAALSSHPAVADALQIAAGTATAVLAAWLVAVAVRRGRLLLVAGAATTLWIGAAGATADALAPRSLRALPLLLVVAAGLGLLATALGALQTTIHAVVRHDVRGRRRWEAAERELTAMETTVKGHRHDVRNMLSAIDGTLVVLSGQRDRLPGVEVDRLLAALRSELQWLQAALGEQRDRDAGHYDLSELLSAIVAVRRTAGDDAGLRLEPGIAVSGHPDRLALAIDNLLANAAVHAPGATVVVATRLVRHPEGPVAEIVVADDGPGLSDGELREACRRGWRGRASSSRPGSGLGLAQCAEWIEADGGSIELGPTHPGRPAGRQGRTVTLRLPALAAGSTAAAGDRAGSDRLLQGRSA